MKSLGILLLLITGLFTSAQLTYAAPIVSGSFSTTWQGNSARIDLGTCALAVYWEEIGNEFNNGTSTSCVGSSNRTDFPSPGLYRVDYSGNFTTIDIDYESRSSFRSVEQWGDSVWTDLVGAFQYVSQLSMPASDAPNLTNVTSLESLFQGATNFNSDIEHWDVSTITNMRQVFGFPGESSAFNQPLNNWNVSNVTDMEWMFFGTPFNQPLDNWDTSSVTNMSFMFNSMPNFNQPLNNWNVSNVTALQSTFGGTQAFNQPLDNWDTSSVINMADVFFQARVFNQPLDNWDTSNVTTMDRMFGDSRVFNQPLDNWDTSSVTNMNSMFESSAFNQSLGSWDVGNVESMAYMFNSSRMSPTNYSDTLIGWSQLPILQNDVTLDALSVFYNEAAATSRQNLTSNFNWIITDGGLFTPPPNHTFVTVWDTRLDPSTSNELRMYITTGSDYNFTINWGDGSEDTLTSNPDDDISHTYSTPGIKTVTITGLFPYFYAGCGDGDVYNKLIDVAQWGTGQWDSFVYSFWGCTYLEGFSATDVPDLSQVESMYSAFDSATAFNDDISDWNVSNVTDMTYMFNGATAFNQRLDSWNITNVEYMEDMLIGTAFTEAKYTRLLNSWSLLPVQPDVYFATDAQYCGATAQAARDILINAPNNWVITDGGATADCVIEVDEAESESSDGSSGTRVGERIKSFFYSSTTSSTPMTVTKESFIQSVRNFIEYLTKNEADLEKLTPEESTKIIVGLRDIIAFILMLIPGV